MAVPSKNFTNIPDGDIDADSPLTETLMTQIRDSLVHLEEWLGLDYSAAKNHDHDGTNSKKIPGGAISSSIQSEAAQSISASSRWTPVEGIYNVTDLGSGGDVKVELYVDSIWRLPSQYGIHATLFCDGANMRIYNPNAGSKTVYYQKF